MSKEFENTLLIGSVFQGIQTSAHQINEDLNSLLNERTIHGYDLVVCALGEKFCTYYDLESLAKEYGADDYWAHYIDHVDDHGAAIEYLNKRGPDTVVKELLAEKESRDSVESTLPGDVEYWALHELQQLIAEMSTGIKLVFFFPNAPLHKAMSWLALDVAKADFPTNQRQSIDPDSGMCLMKYPWSEWCKDSKLSFQIPDIPIHSIRDVLLTPGEKDGRPEIGNWWGAIESSLNIEIDLRVVATSVLNHPRVIHLSTRSGGECILAPLPDPDDLPLVLEHLQYGRYMTGSSQKKAEIKKTHQEWFYEAFDAITVDPNYEGWSDRRIIEEVIMKQNEAKYVYETYNRYLKER
ncbi:hypothetical protein PDESU_06269 [Pontiella desulfatans]|uniref:Uncharacterized protein n=1 Tax=Pontiella desulfatans TaxID=2750659 RepID=A0A6C2UDP5_PONDE|nr:hypothetical protein [Pontiella desulfatans]VGO17667.1 hypothetical protein PDESU_06269 [Pontiella desulfatans]